MLELSFECVHELNTPIKGSAMLAATVRDYEHPQVTHGLEKDQRVVNTDCRLTIYMRNNRVSKLCHITTNQNKCMVVLHISPFFYLSLLISPRPTSIASLVNLPPNKQPCYSTEPTSNECAISISRQLSASSGLSPASSPSLRPAHISNYAAKPNVSPSDWKG
jgi:hypothetical protein